MTYDITSVFNNPVLAPTGRVINYLNHPNRGILPISCTCCVYPGITGLWNTLRYITEALQTGAGIDVDISKLESVNSKDLKNIKRGKIYYSPAKDISAKIPTDRSYTNIFTMTMITVADTMWRNDEEAAVHDTRIPIVDSWRLVIDSLMDGRDVWLDLSYLRPAGTKNDKGMIASGPQSFLLIYKAIEAFINTPTLVELTKLLGTLADVVRRGGFLYKKGIVTASCRADHPEFIRWAKTPLKYFPGSLKKKVIVFEGEKLSNRLTNFIPLYVNDGNLMLSRLKRRDYEAGYRFNVCQGIMFRVDEENFKGPSCLLQPVNLAQIPKYRSHLLTFEAIVDAFGDAVEFIAELRIQSKRLPQYLEAKDDLQVGVEVIGFANLLSNHNIRYIDFITKLEEYLDRDSWLGCRSASNDSVDNIVRALITAYTKAGQLADLYSLERAFTIEPTQSVAYRYKGINGEAVAKNINPPQDRVIIRGSEVVDDLSSQEFFYGATIETMPELLKRSAEDNTDYIERLWQAWYKLIQRATNGKGHPLSYDLYHKIDTEWLNRFIHVQEPYIANPTTYYMNAALASQAMFMHKGINVDSSRNENETNNVMSSCSIDNPEFCAACGE